MDKYCEKLQLSTYGWARATGFVYTLANQLSGDMGRFWIFLCIYNRYWNFCCAGYYIYFDQEFYFIIFFFSGVLYGESIFWQNLLLILTGIVSNYKLIFWHSSHLPNCQWRKPKYTIFAFRQTQTIGHITKLLVDCRWKVLPDCFYLLKEDGCDINHSLSCKAYLRKKKL